MTGGKFMPKLHFKQAGFTYGAYGSFTKHRDWLQKFRETGHLKHLYRNELDKVCFAHDATYSDSKDLANRTVSDKNLKDTAHEIARNPEFDRYQTALPSLVYKFFNKKTEIGVIANVKEQLVKELKKKSLREIWKIFGQLI